MNSPKMIFQVESRRIDEHGSIRGVRQDTPPKMESIDYEIIIDTDELDRRLELLHENVKKYGTVFNTVAPGTTLRGILRRKEHS